MQHINWNSELEIGINVIDGQHKRIIEYINNLIDMKDDYQKEKIAELINALIDYTYSHFAFEEALMEEAGYEYLYVHQRTHEAFTSKINKLHDMFIEGQDVGKDIGELLQTWLLNHIAEDDQSYAPIVKDKLSVIQKKDSGNWIKSTIGRFFN